METASQFRLPSDLSGAFADRGEAARNGHEKSRCCEQAARELHGVASVQRLLLPSSLPAIPGYDAAVSYRPVALSGGDYYDFLPLSDGRIGLFIADVNGHGAPAAVGVAMLCATIRAAPDRTSPARFMSWVNAQMAGGYASGRGNFVTAFYAVLDPATSVLTYASAGHNPPLLWSSRGWGPLDRAQRLPLGLHTSERFAEAQAMLDPGGALVLYTDGITDARNVEGHMFGTRRLSLTTRCASDTAEATCRRVQDTIAAFTGSRPAADDQTLVVLTAF